MADRSPVNRLRSIAAACEGGALGDDGLWLARRIQDYLDTADRGGTLDMACELVPVQGGEPWWSTEARQRRDEAIRELAAKHYADHPAPARAIAEVAGRYETSAWRFDQHSTAPPASYQGTPRELLFNALTAAPIPGERQLRRILAATDMECNILMSVSDPDSLAYEGTRGSGHEYHHAASST